MSIECLVNLTVQTLRYTLGANMLISYCIIFQYCNLPSLTSFFICGRTINAPFKPSLLIAPWCEWYQWVPVGLAVNLLYNEESINVVNKAIHFIKYKDDTSMSGIYTKPLKVHWPLTIFILKKYMHIHIISSWLKAKISGV